MKINILLCDTFPGLLPPEIPSYVYMFEKLFRSVNPDTDFQVFMAMDEELPTDIRHDEIYLITGCNRSVYEQEEWISKLLQWIRYAADAKAYTVGICFGHQAIAQALGGRVEKYAGGWGTGIRESVIVDESLRHFFPSDRMHLLYNHHDQVVKLPINALPLATSAFCTYEAFRIGDCIFGFQGHPEYTADYELHLLRNHAADEEYAVKQHAIESMLKYDHEGQAVARFIISQFAK